ncbi:MAG: PhnD/SsuA/transferrin family substrate-binding protein [Deltaproteobacteria bacterium]|nr:PhnD/SsuA/transferrin family substrate-binding protein [Deltaproteobacteria bacterium]
MRIGVLSHRGETSTLYVWTPTADYLSATLDGYRFTIVPLAFDRVNGAVDSGAVDFILVNPGIYVNLEVQYRVSRIATMNNRRGNNVPYNIFGGVIFSRRDRLDLKRLEDLRDQRFMAVDETSLGGFQMAWRELNANGINPYEDFSALIFGGIHDEVVLAVLNRDVDVGTVRTDILERMAAAGTVRLDDFHIINPQTNAEFPFAHSTRLYPEWPFSKVRHTSNDLAQQVAIALLQMPGNHPAALTGNYAGWTIPLDYEPVHVLFRELNLPPYRLSTRFTLRDAVNRYWYWLVFGATVLLFLGIAALWETRLNKRLKMAKLRLELQHELILNSVADGIYGVDRSGNSTFVNRAMEEITGWKGEEIIGHNQHEILHHTRADGSSHPAEECPVYTTFRDNAPRYVEDDLFWKKDGTSFPVEYTCTPIRAEGGSVLGSVVVFRDITERKETEERTLQHQLQLAHVARLSTLGEMASGIAHELNQPLTSITMNARACVHMLDSSQTAVEACPDVMEKIAAEAQRAGEVIRQIRHFIRKDQPERQPVRVSNMVREVLLLIRADVRQAEVQVKLELDPIADRVLAQDIQIEQVMLNLVLNAIEAMAEMAPGVRRLVIGSGLKSPDMVEISVSDTGPGLSEEVTQRLFTPFVTTKPQGLGLGLSISSGIIDAHDSTLRVESRPGKGATFSFTLPLYREDREL